MAAGVNNLNPFITLDDQNKYGRRAHYLKPNLNTSFLNLLYLTFEYGAFLNF